HAPAARPPRPWTGWSQLPPSGMRPRRGRFPSPFAIAPLAGHFAWPRRWPFPRLAAANRPRATARTRRRSRRRRPARSPRADQTQPRARARRQRVAPAPAPQPLRLADAPRANGAVLDEAFEVVGHLGGALVAVRRVAGDRLEHHRLQVPRHRRVDLPRPRRL